jgi:hypothetical protein
MFIAWFFVNSTKSLRSTVMRHLLFSLSTALFLGLSAGVASAQTETHQPVEPSLDDVRAAADRYRDVSVALEEGYIPDPMNVCDTAEMMGQPAELGVMGIHYLRPDLLGITKTEPRVDGTSTHTDFLQPSVLIYEPQEDGTLELIAVENLVFKKSWEQAGHTAAPTFQNVAYNLMEDDPATDVDEAHMFEPHYDLHVWLFRENPNGTFAQYNPAATCAYHKPAAPGHHQH